MASHSMRVEEDGGERRWVQAEVGESCTLGELESWLARVFGLAQGSWTFTLAGRRPGEEASYMGPGDDVTRPGEDVEIGALAWRKGVRWIHRTSAAPFRLREIAVGARAAGDVRGVRELARGAQGRSAELDAERLAARVLQTALEWEQEVVGERTPEVEVLRARGVLALDALRWIGRDDERQGALEVLADGEGLLWLLDLPSTLGEADQHEQALELCEALAFVRGAEETRGERLFLLARAGRTGEAREEAERWLERSPDEPWTWLLTSDLFALLGEAQRAREGLERAMALADNDLDLQTAVLERRLASARDAGDARGAAELEAALEDLQLALEEESADVFDEELDEEGDREDAPDDEAPVGGNDLCPCGSGMKYKRCCGAGAGAGAPRGDAALVVELLEELAREADQPRVARVLQEALPRFAGAALAGFGLGAALPLLPRDDLPEALVHWAVLDCDLGDGTRVIERVVKRRKRAGARELELFARLADSAPSAWRVAAVPGARDVRLVDQLDAAADPVLLRQVDDLPDGAVLCARLLQLDGETVLGPGTILLEGEPAERWLGGVRARLARLRAAEPGRAWPDFLRRHAHELYRPLAES